MRESLRAGDVVVIGAAREARQRKVTLTGKDSQPGEERPACTLQRRATGVMGRGGATGRDGGMSAAARHVYFGSEKTDSTFTIA
jgi:hypothetical protein